MLDPWNIPLWRAWLSLSRSRRIGFGAAGPVPISEIEAYVRLLRPDLLEDRDEAREFVEQIHKLDEAHWKVTEELRDKGGKDKD